MDEDQGPSSPDSGGFIVVDFELGSPDSEAGPVEENAPSTTAAVVNASSHPFLPACTATSTDNSIVAVSDEDSVDSVVNPFSNKSLTTFSDNGSVTNDVSLSTDSSMPAVSDKEPVASVMNPSRHKSSTAVSDETVVINALSSPCDQSSSSEKTGEMSEKFHGPVTAHQGSATSPHEQTYSKDTAVKWVPPSDRVVKRPHSSDQGSSSDQVVKMNSASTSANTNHNGQGNASAMSEAKRSKIDKITETEVNLQKPRGRQRNEFCLISHCEVDGRGYPKVHAYRNHIPGVFDLRLPCDNPRVLNLRKQALRQVTEWLMGKTVDFQRLVELVNTQALIHIRECSVSKMTADSISAFSKFLNLPMPDQIHLCPVNCVAALIDWRCLNILASLLEPSHHDYWRKLFPTPDLSSPVPLAFDSHFHLDRLQKYAHLRGADVTQTLDAGTVAKDRRVQILGAVANFCDPETYPNAKQLSDFPPELSVAVGIHPKHASRSSRRRTCDLEDMHRLLQHPRVIATGIGLDHSVRDTDWHTQNELIRQLIPRINPNHIVVIQCQGIPDDNGLEANFLLLHLLQGLSKIQILHYHGFTGCPLIRDSWLREFPDTYFSYNRGVESFSTRQINALVGLDESRLLLETNAPYFPREKRPFSAPNELYDVAEMVASHRKTTAQHILKVTMFNALQLYRPK